MEPPATLDQLVADASARIAASPSLGDLRGVEGELLGRGSTIADARAGLRDLGPDERRTMGRLVNQATAVVTEAITARRIELEREETAARLAGDAVDVTLPGRSMVPGTLHVIRQVMDEIVDIFVSLGYTVATGPEAETDWYNFTALNFKPDHPARAETDTLYLDYGDTAEGVLLRTHTSPMQARYMEQHQPPVHLVVPGRVFRRDPLDPTHSPVFHQIEGLAVDSDITFADLKGTLTHFAREFLGPDLTTKFLPHYFPFTEPSAEMHVLYRGAWLELLGCGMVHPAVFEHVGYEPKQVTGFAFGMGADRMAMVRHGVTDIRHLFDPDLRILMQYR
ncbi:MAG: phenylalanine--tRNA ligase subunit alpha [Acidimicrobiia bacterium]|nr:phenylalanine--tRNA ligase subunit alpha [Acidimicrobiia bacterium]